MSVSYFHTYKSHIKGRWLNKPLNEALTEEFTHRPASYYTNAILSHAITINEQPTKPDKILSSNDILYHTVHIHEPLPKPLKIIKIESEYLVVEKPFGVPCHPTTEYFHCSISQSLKQFVYTEIFNDSEFFNKEISENRELQYFGEDKDYLVERNDTKTTNCYISQVKKINRNFNEEDFPLLLNFNFATFNPKVTLSCINRLDLPVSGILIIAFFNSQKYHKIIKSPSTKKFYVALVKGNFPDKISVNKKLKFVKGKKSFVDEEGKESFTDFVCLKRNNEYSLIECMPVTGRPHQIRAHLSSIGFPIINDIKYGYQEIPKESDSVSFGCSTPLECTEEHSKYYFAIKNCKGIQSKSFRNYNEYICLHAYKYIFNGFIYECKLPAWANL